MKIEPVKNLLFPTSKQLADAFTLVQDKKCSSGETWVTSIFAQQILSGSQLFVEKAVSDELKNIDLYDISYDNVHLISKSIEVYFEDPMLSSVIVSKASVDYKDEDYVSGELMIFLFVIKVDGSQQMLALPFMREDYENILKKNGELKFKGNIGNQERIYQRKEIIEFYIRLVTKVLLYISIPEYKAIPITKKQLGRHGKPGVNNRPDRPINKVIYVPTVINIEKRDYNEGAGSMKSAHMRRGHFRMLRSEKFKEQGKLIFIRSCMIHGGSIKDKLYVARKI
jgi:hypothetical protein